MLNVVIGPIIQIKTYYCWPSCGNETFDSMYFRGRVNSISNEMIEIVYFEEYVK